MYERRFVWEKEYVERREGGSRGSSSSSSSSREREEREGAGGSLSVSQSVSQPAEPPHSAWLTTPYRTIRTIRIIHTIQCILYGNDRSEHSARSGTITSEYIDYTPFHLSAPKGQRPRLLVCVSER